MTHLPSEKRNRLRDEINRNVKIRDVCREILRRSLKESLLMSLSRGLVDKRYSTFDQVRI